MELYWGPDQQNRIRGDFIKRAVLRTDLVPIPLTLEADIRLSADSADYLAAGKSIYTYAGDELEILKVDRHRQALALDNSPAGYVRLVAVLKAVAPVAYLRPQAVIKRGAPLSEVYRACGATLRRVEGDVAVPRFICLAGEVPTFHIARALQEAGGVVAWKDRRLVFSALPALWEQRPVESAVEGATEEVRSGFLERHTIPAFYSLTPEGGMVFGDTRKPRAARFHPGADELSLRAMSRCLVLTRVARLRYTLRVAAGDLVQMDTGEKLVAITVATVFQPGADGDEPLQFTKAWLGRLEPPT